MAVVEINPAYAALLDQLGLASAEQFLALPGVVVSGHPDRHVVQVMLGSMPAFLKREHRIPWRDRLVSALTGQGFRSKSMREARALRELRAAGIGCPDWIAAGEDRSGRAFLLVRELTGAVALSDYLRSQATTPRARQRLARRIGQALARLHAAGYTHGDLYSKHVLIDAKAIHWLDWPRVRRRAVVSWRARCRDLAALHATLAETLASSRERLLCLHTYLRAASSSQYRVRAGSVRNGSQTVAHASGSDRLLPSGLYIRAILAHAARLERRRYVREMREPPPAVVHRLIWLDGEALCVTPQFRRDWAGPLPRAMLLREALPVSANQHVQPISLPDGSRALLVRGEEQCSFASLLRWFRGRAPESRAIRQAAFLFRLERHGLPAPRLLAFGQWAPRWNRLRSFLLSEPVPNALRIAQWSEQAPPPTLRRQLVRDAGLLLRQCHRAGFVFERRCAGSPERLCASMNAASGKPTLAIDNVDRITLRRRVRPPAIARDLVAVAYELGPLLTSETDRLRLVLAYLDTPRLTAEGRRLHRQLRHLPRGNAPVSRRVEGPDSVAFGGSSPRPAALV